MVKIFFIACREYQDSSLPPLYFNTSVQVDIDGDVDDLEMALVAEHSRNGVRGAVVYKVGHILISSLGIVLI